MLKNNYIENIATFFLFLVEGTRGGALCILLGLGFIFWFKLTFKKHRYRYARLLMAGLILVLLGITTIFLAII